MTATTEAPPRKWTEADMKAALWRHFTAQGYAVLEEFSTEDADRPYSAGRRIDVLCIRAAKRKGIGPYELLAIEVKVTRSDFLQDVRRPEKQAPWRALAHRHAYAVPAGLVAADEVPEGHGLLVVSGGHGPGWDRVSWERQIRFENKAPVLPARFLTALAWRAARAEAIQHGRASWGPSAGMDDPADMRAKIERLTKQLQQASDGHARAQADLRVWRTYAKSLTGAPCGTCGQELRATKKDRAGWEGLGWSHTDPAHETACEAIRRELAHQQLMDVAIKDHEYDPKRYPAVDPATWQPRYLHVPAAQPNYDEEPPTDG